MRRMNTFRFLNRPLPLRSIRAIGVFLLFLALSFTDLYAAEALPDGRDKGEAVLFSMEPVGDDGLNSYRAKRMAHPVRGAVTNDNGDPLVGVTVKVEGSDKGTITDSGGKYTLDGVADDATLVFSYMGYETQRIVAGSRAEVNVILRENVKELDQVVVVGYGVQKKINLTGAITQVSGKELEGRMTPNLVSGLQGIVPNFNISYGNSGGEPGAMPNFNLRGPGSLSGGSPLVLVDGIPQSMASVNSNDIASISVLKDASASAIYGVRAAYGVILITTKKGTKGSKPEISLEVSSALQKPTKLPDIVNSFEFATMVNDAFINSGQQKKFPDQVMKMIMEEIKYPGKLPTTIPLENSNEWNSGLNHANMNAYDEFYKEYTVNKNYNLSVSGGGNAVTYFLSGGLYDQGAQFRYGDEYYRRYTFTANVDAQVTKWLKVGVNSKYINRKYRMPHVYPLTGDYYHDVPRRWPIWPIRDANGHFDIITLALMADGGRKVTDENHLLNSFVFQADITPNWKVNADFNFRKDFNSSGDHTKMVYLYKVDNTPSPHSYSVPNGYTAANYQEDYRSTNLYTTYQSSLKKNNFKIMLGVQSELDQATGFSLDRNNLITDDVPFITTATGTPTIGGSRGHWGTLGVFGRLNYNFDEKYLFEFSSRYDGTSRFREGRRWGLFPSASVGYNIAREHFWEEMADKVSMFKFRASYGTLGNQSISGLYPYLANLGINTNLDWIMGAERPLYVTAPGLVSPDLTWETTTTFNLGMDIEALKDRFSLTFDWYNRETDNMFGPLESFPGVLGVNPPRRNNASMETKGFELTVGWKDKIRSVGYYVNAHLANNISTITKYQNKTGTLTTYYEGKTLGEIWGYTAVGLFQSDEEIAEGPDQSYIGSNWTQGDVHYADLNGDGKVDRGQNTLTDHGDFSILGNDLPRYTFAVDLGVEWRGFDLKMLWQGVGRRTVWLGGNFLFGDFGNYNQITIFKEHLDYWRPDNPDAYFPKPYMTSLKLKDLQLADRWLQDASYLRLKNLEVGYNFSSELLEKISLRSLRIYFTGENLLTFTRLIGVFDPEILTGAYGSGKSYPIATTYALGIKLNFK